MTAVAPFNAVEDNRIKLVFEAEVPHKRWRKRIQSPSERDAGEFGSQGDRVPARRRRRHTVEEKIMPGTVRLHRVLATKPDKVYRAFTEADAMAKWLPPNGFTCTVHSFDAKVGGGFKMSFRNFTNGQSHSFGGKYVELVPGERLRYTDTFDDPNLPGEMQVTVTLKKVLCGTELNIEQAGIPDAIPVEMCYLGWQDSLRNLASLVEPEINQ
jgi:uncharacterized protein YndB with AHSA1/START domain